MKKHVVCICIFLAYAGLLSAQQVPDWHLNKSTHFIIHYQNAPEDFIARVADEAEAHYNKIADNLGFMRFNFWLWDKRAHIYIYDTAQDYLYATGQPGWSLGSAVPKNKVIYTFVNEKNLFDVILPHEMGHIIFREFVGFNNYAIPLWLDEGVACYQEKLERPTAYILSKDMVASGKLIPLDRLSRINPLSLQALSAQLFYAESVSAVQYLINQFGRDAFIVFCQRLRDTKDFNSALEAAYSFATVVELNQAWMENLKR